MLSLRPRATFFTSAKTSINVERRCMQFGMMLCLFALFAGIQYLTNGALSTSTSITPQLFTPDSDMTSIRTANNRDFIPTTPDAASRHLLFEIDASSLQSNDTITFGHFGTDHFNYGQLRKGAVLLHILCSLVMFIGLSIVSDEYFEPALDILSKRLHLSESVAGATIMALGGSAPELFVMFYSVFVSESDIGLGTIFGSAGVNQLGLLALISVFCEPTELTPFPIARDCFYYCLGVFTLLIVLSRDDKTNYPNDSAVVHWYAALGLLGGYLLYLAVMYYNDRIEKFVNERIKICAPTGGPDNVVSTKLRYVLFENKITSILWDIFIYSVILINISVVLYNVGTGYDDKGTSREYIDIACKCVFGLEMLLKLIALDPVCYWTDPFNAFDGFLVYLIIVEVVLSSSITAGVRAVRLFRLFRGLRGLRGARMFKTCFGGGDEEDGGFECVVEVDENGVQRLDANGNKLLKHGADGKPIHILDAEGKAKRKPHPADIGEAQMAAAKQRLALAGMLNRTSSLQKTIMSGRPPPPSAARSSTQGGMLGAMFREPASNRMSGGMIGGMFKDPEAMLGGSSSSPRPLAAYPGAAIASPSAAGGSSAVALPWMNQFPPGMAQARRPSILGSQMAHGGRGIQLSAGRRPSGNKGSHGSLSQLSGTGKVSDSTSLLKSEGGYTPFRVPDGHILTQLVWLVGLPLAVGMHYTIPDPRSDRWKKGYWFLLTILMCLVWIGAITYLLLWVTLTIGVTLHIKDTVMGLVWMAFGTSVPDILQSLSAARQGQGDGAVAGAIGSNVFNLVFAIPFVWLWSTGIIFPGTVVAVASQNLVMSLMVILICMALSMLVIHFGGWRLTPIVGAACFTLYIIFLVFVVLLEEDQL